MGEFSPIKDDLDENRKFFLGVDFAKIESRISAILKIDDDLLEKTKNDWYEHMKNNLSEKSYSPKEDMFKDNQDSLMSQMAEHVEKFLLKSDHVTLAKLAKLPLIANEENKLLAGIAYHLIWFLQKAPPQRKKKAFYRKLGRIYSVDRRELQKHFERLYPLISTHKKLFPNKFNLYGKMGPIFRSKKLKKFVDSNLVKYSIKILERHIPEYPSLGALKQIQRINNSQGPQGPKGDAENV